MNLCQDPAAVSHRPRHFHLCWAIRAKFRRCNRLSGSNKEGSRQGSAHPCTGLAAKKRKYIPTLYFWVCIGKFRPPTRAQVSAERQQRNQLPIFATAFMALRINRLQGQSQPVEKPLQSSHHWQRRLQLALPQQLQQILARARQILQPLEFQNAQGSLDRVERTEDFRQ